MSLVAAMPECQPPALSKACRHCGEVKPLDGFVRLARARDGRRRVCKACDYAARKARATDDTLAKGAARVRAWKRRNPQRVREMKADARRRKGARPMVELRAEAEVRRKAAETARLVAQMDAAVLLDIQRTLHAGTWREPGITQAERYRRRYREDEG